MKKNHLNLRNKQQGVVMIITLLVLLLLTVIGVNAMQLNTYEEKMAGNMRNRNLAFEAAEATLRHAEQEFIENLANTTNFTGSDGLYGESDNEPAALFDALTWVNAYSRIYDGSISEVYSQPRFMVRKVTEIEPTATAGSDLGLYGYGHGNNKGETATIFRVTARGVGGSSHSQVVLQSHYGMYGLD